MPGEQVQLQSTKTEIQTSERADLWSTVARAKRSPEGDASGVQMGMEMVRRAQLESLLEHYLELALPDTTDIVFPVEATLDGSSYQYSGDCPNGVTVPEGETITWRSDRRNQHWVMCDVLPVQL